MMFSFFIRSPRPHEFLANCWNVLNEFIFTFYLLFHHTPPPSRPPNSGLIAKRALFIMFSGQQSWKPPNYEPLQVCSARYNGNESKIFSWMASRNCLPLRAADIFRSDSLNVYRQALNFMFNSITCSVGLAVHHDPQAEWRITVVSSSLSRNIVTISTAGKCVAQKKVCATLELVENFIFFGD